MKKIALTFMCFAALVSCGRTADDSPKISIFCDHIKTVAEQEGITFDEAAAKIRDIGYTGVDVWVGTDMETIGALDKQGFKHACAVARINFCSGDQPEAAKEALDFAKNCGFDKLLVIPGNFGEDSVSAETVAGLLSSFTSEASDMGIRVMVEDIDNVASPCCGCEGLKALFTAVPGLTMNFDTGNFLAIGEDCWKATEFFRDRTAHVHLKDRMSESDLSCPAVGEGCLPLGAIILRLASKGYDGWFAVEHFGSKNMLADATKSYAFVKEALECEEMTPEMTEYYYPEVKAVTPEDYAVTAVPEGAKVLFDGSSLDDWCDSDGNAAGWILNGDGTMTVNKDAGDIMTKDEFESFVLHIEWRVPEDIEGESQARGNSGVFMHGLYEVQVLDNFINKTYIDGMAGSIYKQSVPAVNPCRAPGNWNVYDITFKAPVTDAQGNVTRPRISVVFNGFTVQDDFEILGTTEYIGFPVEDWPGRGPIKLQSHGDPSKPISFQNIWIKAI